MSARYPNAIRIDFAEVLSYLQGRPLVPGSLPQDVLNSLRIIHRYTYSIMFWKVCLQRIPACGRPFINEMASDALQVLPHVCVGFSKTARLLVRGMVENLVRYIYFVDHPVEFDRLHGPQKWFPFFKDLSEYAQNHPHFDGDTLWRQALVDLSSIYSELSESVHGQRVTDLEMRSEISSVQLVAVTAETEATLVKRAATSINLVLAMFHSDQYLNLSAEEKRIVSRNFSKPMRLALSRRETS